MNNLSLNLQNLQSLAQKVQSEIKVQINNLQKHHFTAIDAKGSHDHIKSIYDNTMVEIAKLKNDISQKTSYSNQEEMFTTASQVTEIETTIEKAYNCFTDILLTDYATAKINYGRACIGPNITAFETNDTQIQKMLKNCSSLREIRGDGNCFVSAFTARFLETLMAKNALGDFLNFIIDDGIIDDDIKLEIGETLMSLSTRDLNLEKTLLNNSKVLPFIKYFRLLAADEMRQKPEQFEEAFRIDLQYNFDQDVEGKSYEDLISKYVLAMGADFSHTAITALCQRLDFSVNIIDPKLGSADGKNILDHKNPEATFFRKGAHYLVLYTNQEKPVSITNTNNIITTNTAQPISINTNNISTKSITTQKQAELVFHCTIPVGNALYIRGDETAGLSWSKGINLIEKGDTWVFKSEKPLTCGNFKILFNDEIWENWNGNRKFGDENSIRTAPTFNLPKDIVILENPVVRVPVITTPITPVKVEVKETLPKISMIQFRILTKSPSDKPFARGNGPEMENWTKGIELYNNYNGTWSFRFAEGSEFDFKILMNNDVKQYENFSGNRNTRDKDGIKDVKF